MAMKMAPVLINKAVTSAGTAERLVAASTLAKGFTLQAGEANTNPAHLGDSTVDYSSKPGISLGAGEWVTLEAPGNFHFDLYDWWVDVETNGEGVKVLYWL